MGLFVSVKVELIDTIHIHCISCLLYNRSAFGGCQLLLLFDHCMLDIADCNELLLL